MTFDKFQILFGVKPNNLVSFYISEKKTLEQILLKKNLARVLSCSQKKNNLTKSSIILKCVSLFFSFITFKFYQPKKSFIMKKQILSLAVIALLALAVQSCKKEEPKLTEEELTIGNKVDTLATDIKEIKDTAVTKTEGAAQDVKDATKKAADDVENAAKKTATDVKDATKKGAEKVEGAAKAAKDGTVKTAKEVNDALKK